MAVGRGSVIGVAVVVAGVDVVAGVGWLSVEPVPPMVVLLPEELEVPGSVRLMGGDLLSSRLLVAGVDWTR